jgi:hypothetical protein
MLVAAELYSELMPEFSTTVEQDVLCGFTTTESR